MSERRRAELDAQRAASNPALAALRVDAQTIRTAIRKGEITATPELEAIILRAFETGQEALLALEGAANTMGGALDTIATVLRRKP